MNSIRSMAASLAVGVALATAANTQAHSAPIPYTLQADPEVPSITTERQQRGHDARGRISWALVG
jgi:hypothetical protein